jgi:hypothetical protein
MSDSAIARDSLHHYDNRHIQVRWDFFQLCAYDKAQFNCRLNGNGKVIKDEPNQECCAKILRILETLTNHEKLQWYLDTNRLSEQGLTQPPEPREFPIRLSYSAIVSLLYATYGESTVRNSIAYLIRIGFIRQYQQTNNSIPFYVLRIDAVQKALKDQAEQELSGVEINSQAGESFWLLKSTAKPLKSTAKPLKSTAKPLKSTPIISSKKKEDISEEEESVADETAISPLAPIVATTPTLSSLSCEVTHHVDKLSTNKVAATKPAHKEKTPPPKNTEPTLSDKARAVWEVWLQMPWNKDLEPTLTPTAAKHCEKLSTIEITVDIMFKVRNFAKKNDNNGYYEGKAWTLGNVVKEYPNWKSAEYKIELQIPKKQKLLEMTFEQREAHYRSQPL